MGALSGERVAPRSGHARAFRAIGPPNDTGLPPNVAAPANFGREVATACGHGMNPAFSVG